MTRRRVSIASPPRAIWLAAGVGVAFVALPLVALMLRVPWTDLWAILAGPTVGPALRISLVASAWAVLLALVFGLPLAYVFARVDFPGKAIARAVVLLPLVLPPVVGGAALLLAFGRRGLLGEPLYLATGLVLPFSLAGVVLAVTFVSMPFLVITAEGAFRGLDARYEGAAETLGASPWRVLRRVTLPLIRPSLVSGMVLTWARALGEFGATLVFAGNLPERTQTLPLAVFVTLDSDRDTAMALSLVMVAVSFALLVALRDRWWPSR